MPLLLLGLLVWPLTVHAQRHSLDSLVAATAAPIAAICGAPDSVDQLLRRERLLSERAPRTTPDTLDNLACTRARLYLAEAIARESWNMPLGTSWHEGAIEATLATLDAAPTAAYAADLLGALATAERTPRLHEAIATRLIRGVQHGSRGAWALRGCSEVARRVQAVAEAIRCSHLAMELGRDVVWHGLHLARLAFLQGDSALAVAHFEQALIAAEDSSWHHVEWHLRWFLEPDELDAWHATGSEGRAAWLRGRLAARDIRDGRSQGSRLAEHFARLEYVDRWFRYPLALRNLARLRHAATPESQLPRGHIHKYWEPGVVPAEPFRFYRSGHPEYDDRAAVWMRFGQPTQRIRWTLVDKSANRTDRHGDPPLVASLPAIPANNVREGWTYEVDDLTLVLNFEGERFTGTTEATRLVAGVLGSYLCDLDSWRCNLTMRASAAGLPPLEDEHIATLREVDREHLTQATTKDDHGVRAARSITTLARLHRVWDPASGAVLGVVPWAVRTADVAAGQDTATTFTLTVRQWDPGTGAWLEAAIPRALRLPSDRPSDGFLTGHAVVASGAGVSAWSVVAAQDTIAWGRAWADRVAPLGGGALAISDLVLGAASQGQVWRTTGGTEVPLAPLGAFERREPMTLYWQVRSVGARDALRTTVALYQTAATREEPALQIAFTSRVGAGLTEELRDLDISRLAGGRYRVEVVLTDPRDGATVRRSGELLVK